MTAGTHLAVTVSVLRGAGLEVGLPEGLALLGWQGPPDLCKASP